MFWLLFLWFSKLGVTVLICVLVAILKIFQTWCHGFIICSGCYFIGLSELGVTVLICALVVIS